MPIADELTAKWKAWKAAGALTSEMETAALYDRGAGAACSVRRGAQRAVERGQRRRSRHPARRHRARRPALTVGGHPRVSIREDKAAA
ncbi:MAG: hypothetical protein ACLR4Z_06455 [Butyricicoccaceae bacterium]